MFQKSQLFQYLEAGFNVSKVSIISVSGSLNVSKVSLISVSGSRIQCFKSLNNVRSGKDSLMFSELI